MLSNLSPAPPSRASITGRAILERTVIHVPDVELDAEYGHEVSRAVGFRSALGVPILRDGIPLGVIGVSRAEPGPFSDNQIALLRTFADQALIAIENVRLFTELEARNAALTQSLEQQTATGEILRVISSSPTELQPVFATILANACRLCSASLAVLWRFDGEFLVGAAHHNASPRFAEAILQPVRPSREGPARLAALERRVVHIADITVEPGYDPMVLQHECARTVLAAPLLRDDRVVGVVAMWRREIQPFTDNQIALLQTFADQAVIAIENVRLFTELQEKNRALTETLDQQTATSEILRVIARSPTNLQPVLDALVENAGRLCQSAESALLLVEGNHLSVVATSGYAETAGVDVSHPIHRGWVAGRAVADARTVHVEDLANAEAEFPLGREIAIRFGHRAALATPLLRDGTPIGALFLRRREVRQFSDKEIALLQTFADQAIIAIENVRLFTELQQKNQALTQAHVQVTQSLDQQTATSEILKVISRVPTEVQPVFDTIVRNAARLCDAATTTVLRTDGTMLHLHANYGATPEILAAARALFPRPLDMTTASGAAILTRSVVQIPDSEDPTASEFVRQAGRLLGYRSSLAVPMLRGEEAIGAIRVTRREASRFSDADMELLKTFADQAVIAIENVRLFNELEVANRDLKAASQHKSEFLANMSHELRTPLNAVIGFSELLSERLYGDLNEKQEEYLKDIHASGQHLLSLINDILDLSKIEAGRMELDLGTFDLLNVIDTAVLLIRERAGRRGIVLQTTVDERVGEIQGDERKLKQVLLNLLSNAIKFTPEGGRIEIRAKPVNGSVELSVSDTGVGIAPEDQEAIFEEFRQVGTAAKKVEGTGLGLALSRKFIELHGGRIWVESQIGVGSTFTFTIPIRTGT
jgi:two-component system, NtrC family, sensor kinase